ncbi:MAG: hypothetical protein IJL16_04360 [Clostridia bacterium]|jgi:hypothetical protein|nr:hypothetical protein [Clostridia bacterium]
MKKSIALVVLVMMIFVMAGCSSDSNLYRQKPDEGATVYTLEGTLTAEAAGEKLNVSFESNLMTGTAVLVSVESITGEQLASEKVSIEEGKPLTVSFDIDDTLKGKKVYVSVSASPSSGKQPSEVREAYGKWFQNIDGKNIIWDKTENVFLVLSDKIEL